MEEVIETIPVTDAKGDELIVYEYQKFVPHLTALGLLCGGGQKRLMLDTGEAVARVDRETFVIAATGENSCGSLKLKRCGSAAGRRKGRLRKPETALRCSR